MPSLLQTRLAPSHFRPPPPVDGEKQSSNPSQIDLKRCIARVKNRATSKGLFSPEGGWVPVLELNKYPHGAPHSTHGVARPSPALPPNLTGTEENMKGGPACRPASQNSFDSRRDCTGLGRRTCDFATLLKRHSPFSAVLSASPILAFHSALLQPSSWPLHQHLFTSVLERVLS